MSQAIIRRALEKKVATWATAANIRVAYENVEFVPTAAAYARVNLLPAQTVSATLDKVHRGYSGVFQVTLCMPVGSGPSAAETLVASLAAAFPTQTVITESGVTVYIIEPMSAAPAIQDEDRYLVPVSCPYAANTV
jgi:hypothetical protein